MRFGILLAIIFWGTLCVALASTDRPNEPAGSVFLSENAFDSKPDNKWLTAGTWWDLYPTGNAQIIADPSAPKSPSNVLQQKRPPNSHGGTQLGYSFPQPKKEVYVAFWWKPSDPFYGWSNNTQKIASIQPSMNMFFMWFGERTKPRTGGVLLQTATVDNSHAGCPYAFSSCNFYSNMSSGIITGGQWHLIEWYVKLSDSETSKNGILRWWIDKELAGNYTNINMSTVLYDNFQFNHTWDSGDPNQPTTDYHWFDHAYISAPNGTPSVLTITGSPATARVGTPYTTALSASGGTAPYKWFLESGGLPPGLLLNQSTGVISGSPTCGGTSNFAIRVADNSQPALTAIKSFSITTSGTACPSSLTAGAATRTEGSQFTAKAVGGTVVFDLPEMRSGDFHLSIFSLAGKKVYDYKAGIFGRNKMPVRAPLRTGIYLARFAQGQSESTVRFNVMN